MPNIAWPSQKEREASPVLETMCRHLDEALEENRRLAASASEQAVKGMTLDQDIRRLWAQNQRLSDALGQALQHWGAQGIADEDGSAYAECERRLDEGEAETAQEYKASIRRRALEDALLACQVVVYGQEKLASLDEAKDEKEGRGEEIGGAGIAYSSKALGAQHCVEEIRRLMGLSPYLSGGEREAKAVLENTMMRFSMTEGDA